jgi:hypothetical protein
LEFDSWWGWRNFLHSQAKGLLELLHSAYWIFLEVKQVRAVDHAPQCSADIKEKAEL